jgi:hypothetical protein
MLRRKNHKSNSSQFLFGWRHYLDYQSSGKHSFLALRDKDAGLSCRAQEKGDDTSQKACWGGNQRRWHARLFVEEMRVTASRRDKRAASIEGLSRLLA